jgi:hypothetical protein
VRDDLRFFKVDEERVRVSKAGGGVTEGVEPRRETREAEGVYWKPSSSNVMTLLLGVTGGGGASEERVGVFLDGELGLAREDRGRIGSSSESSTSAFSSSRKEKYY